MGLQFDQKNEQPQEVPKNEDDKHPKIPSQYYPSYMQKMALYFNHDKMILKHKLAEYEIYLDENSMIHQQLSIKEHYSTAHGTVVKLQINFGNIKAFITILNISRDSPLHKCRQMEGNCNSVYFCEYERQLLCVKCMRLKENIEFNFLQFVRQFILLKIASVLEVGPHSINTLGFDLVKYKNCLQFCQQECDLTKIPQTQQDKNQLYQNLAILHSLNIIHFDIKPQNICFSPTKAKFIFIDFGLSKQINQHLGFKHYCGFSGSLGYCYPEIQALFSNGEQKDVDLYYNDMYGLTKTLLQFSLESYQTKAFIKEIGKNSFDGITKDQLSIKIRVIVNFKEISIKYYLFTNNFSMVKSFLKRQMGSRLQTEMIKFVAQLDYNQSLGMFYYQQIQPKVSNSSQIAPILQKKFKFEPSPFVRILRDGVKNQNTCFYNNLTIYQLSNNSEMTRCNQYATFLKLFQFFTNQNTEINNAYFEQLIVLISLSQIKYLISKNQKNTILQQIIRRLNLPKLESRPHIVLSEQLKEIKLLKIIIPYLLSQLIAKNQQKLLQNIPYLISYRRIIYGWNIFEDICLLKIMSRSTINKQQRQFFVFQFIKSFAWIKFKEQFTMWEREDIDKQFSNIFSFIDSNFNLNASIMQLYRQLFHEILPKVNIKTCRDQNSQKLFLIIQNQISQCLRDSIKTVFSFINCTKFPLNHNIRNLNKKLLAISQPNTSQQERIRFDIELLCYQYVYQASQNNTKSYQFLNYFDQLINNQEISRSYFTNARLRCYSAIQNKQQFKKQIKFLLRTQTYRFYNYPKVYDLVQYTNTIEKNQDLAYLSKLVQSFFTLFLNNIKSHLRESQKKGSQLIERQVFYVIFVFKDKECRKMQMTEIQRYSILANFTHTYISHCIDQSSRQSLMTLYNLLNRNYYYYLDCYSQALEQIQKNCQNLQQIFESDLICYSLNKYLLLLLNLDKKQTFFTIMKKIYAQFIKSEYNLSLCFSFHIIQIIFYYLIVCKMWKQLVKLFDNCHDLLRKHANNRMVNHYTNIWKNPLLLLEKRNINEMLQACISIYKGEKIWRNCYFAIPLVFILDLLQFTCKDKQQSNKNDHILTFISKSLNYLHHSAKSIILRKYYLLIRVNKRNLRKKKFVDKKILHYTLQYDMKKFKCQFKTFCKKVKYQHNATSFKVCSIVENHLKRINQQIIVKWTKK